MDRWKAAGHFKKDPDAFTVEVFTTGAPEDIQHDVLQYYDYLYMNSKHGKQAILGDVDMSVSLKKRVAIALHVDTIRKIDLFKVTRNIGR